MTLIRAVSAERWWQKTLGGMKKERTSPPSRTWTLKGRREIGWSWRRLLLVVIFLYISGKDLNVFKS